MRRLTTSDFINKAKIIHGDKYDYSMVDYKLSHDKVIIICKLHGEFTQKAYLHLDKQGCSICGKISIGIKNAEKALTRRKYNFKQPVDYKLIPLTKGKLSKVDNECFDDLIKINWQYNSCRNHAVSNKGKMHRYIMSCPEDMQVDHINHDPLDNRKSNLRICTPGENARNTRSLSKSSSKYKGVSFFKRNGKWRSSISFKRKFISLGYYFNEIDAARAYDIAALKYFKDFSFLNFPECKNEYLQNEI